jgi:hypothetical protein
MNTNAVERAISPIAGARENALFARNDGAIHRRTTAMTFFLKAKFEIASVKSENGAGCD